MADITSRQMSRETTGHAERCAAILRRVFDGYGPLDFAVRLWDGSTPIVPESGEPRFTLVINHPAALRRMFLPPSEINLGEAFIFGDFDIEGDIFHAASLIDYFPQLNLTAGDLAWLARNLLALPRDRQADTARPGLRPAGQAHSRRRDRETVQFHYDVSNDFYALWLDDLMVYSCAYFKTGDEDIHTAQRQKLEHICRKLRLRPGERLLDIGCGWGGLLVYAAEHYGVDATGITLSENQADYVGRLIAQRGLADRCRVRLLDYREVPEDNPFDKLVSVGMFEHVGRAKLPVYMGKARRLLKPGGLFLNHAIASMTGYHREPGPVGRLIFRPNSFMQRYVFPDGELVDISVSLEAAEAAGFEARDVESLREHYALTLRHWVRRLTERRAEALRHVDEPTFRVWRLYMAASSYGFASSRINVYQSLLSKSAGGHNGLPWTRAHLYH
jgi:cyclopropane-fatty-acyl-phospholipid synthase